MRTLKVLLYLPAAFVFTIGSITIFSEVRKRITKEDRIDMRHSSYLTVVGENMLAVKIIKIPENKQTLVQVYDGKGNQVDVTCGNDFMTTSHMFTQEGTRYIYFDRDGDGLPEIRSKHSKGLNSVFEKLEPVTWKEKK